MLYYNYKEQIYQQLKVEFEENFGIDFDEELNNDFSFHNIEEYMFTYNVDEDDAWYMKYISETLEYYMYINNVEFRSDYIDTFEDVFITYDLKLEEKNKFQNFYENNFNCIVELFEYILDKIFNSDDFILNYDKMHAKINQCLN